MTVRMAATWSGGDATARARSLLGLSLRSTYRAVNAGQIPSMRMGRRFHVLIPRLREQLGLTEAELAHLLGTTREHARAT